MLVSFAGCQQFQKIEDTTAKEESITSKWLNKPGLKIFYGQPDKLNFKSRNRNYIYITEKYKIK